MLEIQNTHLGKEWMRYISIAFVRKNSNTRATKFSVKNTKKSWENTPMMGRVF
jgi:hypothetical protein